MNLSETLFIAHYVTLQWQLLNKTKQTTKKTDQMLKKGIYFYPFDLCYFIYKRFPLHKKIKVEWNNQY